MGLAHTAPDILFDQQGLARAEFGAIDLQALLRLTVHAADGRSVALRELVRARELGERRL